MMLCIYCN